MGSPMSDVNRRSREIIRSVSRHVLDFSDDVYDMAVEVEFLHRIRAEVKFASIDELKAQLQQDIKIARIYFDL